MAPRRLTALALAAVSYSAAAITLRRGQDALVNSQASDNSELQSEEPVVLATLASARDELLSLLQRGAPPAAPVTKVAAPTAAAGKTAPVAPATKTAAVGKAAPAPLAHPKLPGKNFTQALMKQHDALKDLFKHLKSNIKDINKGEAGGKEIGQKEIEQIKARLAKETEQLKNTSLSSFQRELLTNRTTSDKHALEYWTRSRELEHHMFHSSLKMTHGLMSKVNAVMQAYEEVMKTGGLSAKNAAALKTVAERLPKPAL